MADATTDNFDTYTQVFVYSHAAYPSHDSECVLPPSLMKVGTRRDLKDSVTHESLREVDHMFLHVPENMIIIDPVLSDTYCMSTKAVDTIFPQMVMESKNSGYLNGDAEFFLGFTGVVDDIQEDEETEIYNELYDLYHNAKLYKSGDIYHNLRISFDVNPESIWNIRYIDNTGDKPILKQILGNLSRRTSEPREECIYLRSLLHELESHPELEGKKLAIYLVSCRSWHDDCMEGLTKSEKKQLTITRESVKQLGKDNIQTVSNDTRKHTRYATRSLDTYKPAPPELASIKGGKKRRTHKKKQRKTKHKITRRTKKRPSRRKRSKKTRQLRKYKTSRKTKLNTN
jgi:hypothetical protein